MLFLIDQEQDWHVENVPPHLISLSGMAQAPLPPGPRGSILGGNLPAFRRDRLAFMTRCSREFGGVVRLRLGPRRVFLLTDPSVIEEVLVTQAKNFTKHFALRMN